jgi:anti-sigma B factor antagonist
MKIEQDINSYKRSLFPHSWKERKVPLNLETRCFGGTTVVYCEGRIVFRDEALALSEIVVDLLQQNHDVVLDLTKVDAMDSAGLGELVSLYMLAKANGSNLVLSGLNSRMHHLLELTNVSSLFEIFPTDEAALEMRYSRAD